MALVGNLKDLKLANIIQINCIERNIAMVSVKRLKSNGTIYFNKGAIVHAEYGSYVGERAVHEMLALTDGNFKIETGLEPPRQTITHSWNSVVLEGLRLIDEKTTLNASIPKQLFHTLSELRNVKNVFVLNTEGKIIEGVINDPVPPQSITFVWYKLKKMLNMFYSDLYQYILIRKESGYFFIFEYKKNLIVIETDLLVITSEFSSMVKKVLKQIVVS